MTSCRVRDAPNDLERRRREVAALEKPPQRVFSRRPTRTVGTTTDAQRFDNHLRADVGGRNSVQLATAVI